MNAIEVVPYTHRTYANEHVPCYLFAEDVANTFQQNTVKLVYQVTRRQIT